MHFGLVLSSDFEAIVPQEELIVQFNGISPKFATYNSKFQGNKYANAITEWIGGYLMIIFIKPDLFYF